MSAKQKVLDRLDKLFLVRDAAAGGDTTLDGAAAAGQKVVPVTSDTGFAVGDTVRVGDGEKLELGVVASVQAGVSITLADNLTYDHEIGEDCVEQTVYDMGDVSDGGVTVTGNGETTDILSAMRRLVFAIANGYVDLTAEFSFPTFTLPNFAVALGMSFGSVKGAGTASSPFSLASDGNEFGEEKNQSLIAIGLTEDGAPIRVELWGVDFDYTGISVQLRRGQAAPISVKAVAAAGGVATTNASAYIANVTKKATKGDVFDALEEAGVFEDDVAGGISTLANAAAKGDTVIDVAVGDGADFDDETWVRIGSGDTVEFHQIDGIASDAITLKTPLLRDQAVGVAVVQQTLTKLAGVSEDGVTLAVGGTVTPIRIAENRLSIGLKLGNATVTISFALVSYSLANLARAFGIDVDQITNNRLPLGNKIGTATIDGLYVRGVLKDGTVFWINSWGNSQDVSNVAAAFTQQGVPALPLAVKPASGLHLIAA